MGFTVWQVVALVTTTLFMGSLLYDRSSGGSVAHHSMAEKDQEIAALKEKLKDAESVRDELTHEVEALKAERKKLKRELEVEKDYASADGGGLADKEEELILLRKQLTEAEARISDYSAQATSAQTAAATALKEQMTLKKELDKAIARADECDVRATTSPTQEEASPEKEEKEEPESVTETDDKVVVANRRIAELEEQLGNAEEAFQEARGVIDEAEGRFTTAEAKVADLEERMAARVSELAEAGAELEGLMAENERLAAELEAKTSSCSVEEDEEESEESSDSASMDESSEEEQPESEGEVEESESVSERTGSLTESDSPSTSASRTTKGKDSPKTAAAQPGTHSLIEGSEDNAKDNEAEGHTTRTTVSSSSSYSSRAAEGEEEEEEHADGEVVITPNRSEKFGVRDPVTCPVWMPKRLVGGAGGDDAMFVCGPGLMPQRCVIYSFGTDGHNKFEKAMEEINGRKCVIHTFDPKPYPDIKNFHNFALGTHNDGNIKTLDMIMNELSHPFLDILKMDIDGAEHAVFEYISRMYSDHGWPFGQLLIEIHVRNETETQNTLDIIRRAGYQLVQYDAKNNCDDCGEFVFIYPKLPARYGLCHAKH